MLSADSDIPAVVELMVDNRGDPLKPNAEGKECFRIALAFRSQRVLAWLQHSGT